MASPELSALRALHRRVRAALADTESAVSELRSVEGALGAAINAMLDQSQGAPRAGRRARNGEIQIAYCRALLAADSLPGSAVWLSFDDIVDALPEQMAESEILASLRRGADRLILQRGDEYQLLAAGRTLAEKRGV